MVQDIIAVKFSMRLNLWNTSAGLLVTAAVRILSVSSATVYCHDSMLNRNENILSEAHEWKKVQVWGKETNQLLKRIMGS